MSVRSFLSRPVARWLTQRIRPGREEAITDQKKVLAELVRKASETSFGKEHHFDQIQEHSSFGTNVPVRSYEDFIPWIERVKHGERDVLWPGLPLYFCKTSGTTAGTKYIPLTKDSLPNHLNSARNALLCYIAETGRSQFVDGKMIFLQGSPKLEQLPSGIPYGRLSGIVANHVPSYLQKNRMPSYAVNCIEDWEEKVNAIAAETLKENMSLISGIPSWVQMYFEILLKKSGKSTIREVFPNFNLFVYGGVNFEPYRKKFTEIIGVEIPSIELYPASEGFIAFQDSQENDGLLLNTSSGIYFEFIPTDQYHQEHAPRLSLAEVKMGENYAVVLSNNAGLWGYSIGDTIRFVSLDPPRIKVTGRIKHFTSAFGEHVIAEEVERAMYEALDEISGSVREFHVAPQMNPASGLPYHEWLIEFGTAPASLDTLAEALDNIMRRQNVYYDDLIKGQVLRRLVITMLKPDAFSNYMKSVGKLGGQNKVPRLANDRNLADALAPYRFDQR